MPEPSNCSGAMYIGVPAKSGTPASSSARPESPKSMSRTRPRPSIMMLAGFRSRCRTPFSWAARRPGANLPGNLKSFFTGRTAHPSQDRGKIFAVDVFHGEEVLSVEMTDVEDAADIGMRDLAGETNLVA